MSLESNPVPERERRDFIPFFRRREQQIREVWFLNAFAFAIIIFALSLLIHLFVEPKQAKAAPKPPETVNGVVLLGGLTKADIKTLCGK